MELIWRLRRGDRGDGDGPPGYVPLGGLLALSEPICSAEETDVKIHATQKSVHGRPSAILPHQSTNLALSGPMVWWLLALVSATSPWHWMLLTIVLFF